ncbi:hypothetical protein GGS23DRAFT_605824 [Durotheca rogersii]|uniref:uncharacterized protein n=1 Tax=Durotheca rogersii TaxID=419775 RepID=UPI00221F75F9|nr:uncharacterized protein GGS23DRAFT_605824 [Durotheca rogersii]KAI5862237.1 hypothetical protein GGS23DRAFT_605824 [Durotheca rogersii]
MEDSGSQRESRERLYRAPSRASTGSTVNTQTTKSAASPASHFRETHASPHLTHRYHHSHSGRSLMGTRAPSRLSRESGMDFREPAAASSFLQERLQQERNVEGQRQASKFGIDLSASAGDIRDMDTPSSPIRRSATALGRWQPPDGGDDLAMDPGMGLKRLEKTLSTLHKQNFDLKLDLYHRRQRQTALEEQVEKLEAENSEIAEAHENLASELEMKEKAIQEAVNMIVKLEARVEELLLERDMVRQVEADGSYRHSHADEPELKSKPTPALVSAAHTKPRNLFVPHLSKDANTLERMPSFLSERSEQTENLRNAVLGRRSSIARIRQVSASSVDPSEINRVTSPSLSVLSESSFVSIYGARDAPDKASMLSTDSTAVTDGVPPEHSSTPTAITTKRKSWDKRLSPVQNKTPVGAPDGGGAKLSTHIQPFGNVIDTDSPLQKLEKLEDRMTGLGDASRRAARSSSVRARPTATLGPSLSTKPPHQGRTKQEKREALQKVLTNYSAHRDLASPHAYPPTPDTVSSSTLRKHQPFTSSQDSLEKQSGATTATGEVPPATSDRSGPPAREAAFRGSPSVFSSRRPMPMPSMNPNLFSDLSELAQSLPPRPHSTAGTTSSHTRADSLGSESDSDGGADAHSESDSFDYWMRESMEPNRHHAGSSGQREDDLSSPDLFSFPADTKGWETDVIFGALRGNGYLGSPVSALKRDPLDEMANSLQAQTQQAEALDPATPGQAPPTPDRRSSLHARTGSTSAVSQLGGMLKKSPGPSSRLSWLDGRGRSNSVGCAAQGSTVNKPAEAGKRSQYPPVSGQSLRGRSLGLNSFFKRAGPESASVPSSATEAGFPVPTPAQLPPVASHLNPARLSGRNSVPPPATMPWARPAGVSEDDFKSATPPPIMRNRVPTLLAEFGGIEAAEPSTPPRQMPATPTTPTTIVSSQGGHGNATPGGTQSSMRKWLGLGRMGSLKSRMG